MAECNLSRLALARALGVDKSVVGRWLSGTNKPTGHNLTRLTDLFRRHRPDVTLDFWREAPPPSASPQPSPQPLSDPSDVSASEDGPTLAGLKLPVRPDNDANYESFWAGFYQSTQNRGSVILCAMHILGGPRGLRAVFTEGRVSASGGAVAIGARLHVILEITPLHDRLCLFVMNGVGSPDTVAMEGIYLTSAGESEVCASASPIVLFRIGDATDFARAGGLPGVMRAILPINVRNVPTSVAANDPVAGLADLVPDSVLRLVSVLIGTPRPDGETDFVMRMPRHRSPAQFRFSADELPPGSPVLLTWRGLRQVFNLE